MNEDGSDKVREKDSTDMLYGESGSRNHELKVTDASPEILKPLMIALKPEGRLELFEYLVDAVLKDTQDTTESSTVTPATQAEIDINSINNRITELQSDTRELQSETRTILTNLRRVVASL